MATRSNQHARTNQYRKATQYRYENGSAARQLEAVPERRREQRPERKTKQYPKNRPVNIPVVNGREFIFLVAAIVICMVFGFQYIQTQAGLTKMKNQAVALQNEIVQEKEANSIQKRNILASVDLSEVYEIATNDLGMVQAVDNQVYTYNSKKSDMVKQYADIPAAGH